MSTQITTTTPTELAQTGQAMTITAEQRQLLTDTLCKGGTPTEIEFFLEVARRCKLDPFKKQIYAVKRWDSTTKREALSFQVSIDGLRAIASRTGDYVGSDEPIIETDERGNPVKATCTVWRWVHGERRAFTASVYWAEAVQTKRDGTPNSFWQTRPFGQLGKCAESAALRKGFPEDTSGLYIEEEMRHDDPPTRKLVTGKKSIEIAESRPADDDIEWDAEAEIEPENWTDLIPGNRYADIRVPWADDMTCQELLANRAFAQAAIANNPHDQSMAAFAVDCLVFKAIERRLTQKNQTADDVTPDLVAAGILEQDATISSVDGRVLVQILKFVGK